MSKQMQSDVQDRAKDIERLEKNIRELHEMFLDMAELVAEQSVTIENIEDNVIKTEHHLKDSPNVLIDANKNRKAARKVRFLCSTLYLFSFNPST